MKRVHEHGKRNKQKRRAALRAAEDAEWEELERRAAEKIASGWAAAAANTGTTDPRTVDSASSADVLVTGTDKQATCDAGAAVDSGVVGASNSAQCEPSLQDDTLGVSAPTAAGAAGAAGAATAATATSSVSGDALARGAAPAVVVLGGGKRGFRKKGRAFPAFALVEGSDVPVPVVRVRHQAGPGADVNFQLKKKKKKKRKTAATNA
jgi:hypothetical protein